MEDVSPTPNQDFNAPLNPVTGKALNKIKYLDFDTIRVVFDAETGHTIGVLPIN